MVESAWKVDITSKSSTKYVNPDVLKVGSCHHVWSTLRDNIHDSKRTQIKCKLLTGTYILQANRAAFNQYAVNVTCKLCQSAPETRQHFIGECAEFKAESDSYKEKLAKSQILSRELILQLENPEILTQLTLDASVIIGTTKLDFEKLGSRELYTREYIYRIHMDDLWPWEGFLKSEQHKDFV